MQSLIKKLLIAYLVCVVCLMADSGRSWAGPRADSLRTELQGLDKTVAETLNRVDQLAHQSRRVSREVQILKSERKIGIIEHARVDALLSRLREILVERRELKKIEETLKQEREKTRGFLYQALGAEIQNLLKKGEEEVSDGNIEGADRIHQAVLLRMQERQQLVAHRPLRITALPQIEIPDIEGFSLEEQVEIAILLKDDAETLDKEKEVLIKEHKRLREELHIKETLARFKGFPRGLQDAPIDRQIVALKQDLETLDQAIKDYANVTAVLVTRSKEIFERAKEQEETLLK
ncbi:MAG: hypothetical protein ACE5FY_05870 [Nitrospiria bacterium]